MQLIPSLKKLYKLLQNDRCSSDSNGKKTIQVNNHVLIGCIEYIVLETDLYILTINVDAKEDFIIRDKNNKELERKYFLFSYLRSPHFNDARPGATEKNHGFQPGKISKSKQPTLLPFFSDH